MIHGFRNDFLYCAKKVVATWKKDDNYVTTQGTGFFVGKDRDILSFITNRHVVEPGYIDPQYKDYVLFGLTIDSYKAIDETGQPIEYDNRAIANAKIGFDANRNNDVACLSNIFAHGGLEVTLPISYNDLATEEWINSKLTVCDTIAYPGFPEWFDHKKNTPIFRMGTIASDPRGNYSLRENDPDAAKIAYEGFSSGGASGSPVFAAQKGFPIGGAIQGPDDFFREVKVVGINAGHFEDDKGHSGISYFYKSSVIRSILDRMMNESPPRS